MGSTKGWTRPRRCEYRQTTVQEPWGGTVEAKRASVNPIAAQDQGRHYAEQLGVPFVFLSNGEEVWFLDRDTDAHARKVATFYSPDDLERRIAARRNRLELSSVEIDQRIVDREYQIACIEALSAEVSHGRRKLLVESSCSPSRGTASTRSRITSFNNAGRAAPLTRAWEPARPSHAVARRFSSRCRRTLCARHAIRRTRVTAADEPSERDGRGH